METLAEVYGDDRWGRAYGYKDPIYSGGWHRGQDIRKQVPSGAYSISHDVLALTSGTIVQVTRKTKIGLTIVIDRGAGPARYEFHSHLRNAKVKIGDRVKPGQKIAETALAHENPGTSWGGPHDHVVFSDYSDGSWNTARPVIDPRPIIREARKPPKPAGGGGTPINLGEEDTMTHSIRVDKKHYFSVGAEFIAHHGTVEQATVTRQVTSVRDELHDLTSKQFLDLLDGLGIPRSVVSVKNGLVQFGVLNPETGKHGSNQVWSRTRQAVALLNAKK